MGDYLLFYEQDLEYLAIAEGGRDSRFRLGTRALLLSELELEGGCLPSDVGSELGCRAKGLLQKVGRCGVTVGKPQSWAGLGRLVWGTDREGRSLP